ncbi:MAG: hypothetical protein JST90_11385 [Bacteroidetes bacterium]|nr:hypothetical protein [Bacteroidota bacterium]
MQEPKIELSAWEFRKAMQNGKAVDVNGNEVSWFSSVDLSSEQIIYELNNVIVHGDVWVTNLSFSNKIEISNCEFEGLSFANCQFTKDIRISDSIIKSHLLIASSDFETIEVYSSNFLGLSVNDQSSIQSLIIGGCNEIQGHLSVQNSTIEGLLRITHTKCNKNFYTSKSKISEVIIDYSSFQKITIPSIPEKGILKIIKSQFQEISMHDNFTNLGYMQWNDIHVTDYSKIELINAVMGRWDIINCNLSKSSLAIYSSKITDTFYTNTKFPELLVVPKEFEGIENKHEIFRDGYNQLKTIAQKQNDRRMFLHYQAAELRSYYSTLSWNCKDGPTKFQLLALKWSSDYGTNWLLGIAFTIAANAICLAICYWNYWPTFGKESFWAYAGKFGEYMFSVVKKPEFVHSGFQTAVYYFSRIPIAFGIYQTIAAFRKFGKSE